MALYNRYIHDGPVYTRVLEEDAPPFQPPGPRTAPSHFSPPPIPPSTPEPQEDSVEEPLTEVLKGKGGLSSLLKSLKLDKLDTGDILLLLILLFLFLEGDDIELMITLGLLLLLGLD